MARTRAVVFVIVRSREFSTPLRIDSSRGADVRKLRATSESPLRWELLRVERFHCLVEGNRQFRNNLEELQFHRPGVFGLFECENTTETTGWSSRQDGITSAEIHFFYVNLISL